ncbi:hypothetical protein [Streptomyces chrestomyceticus]|uniref:hypothetical protein n=1 Tax=Streptomyces chrestomyceticus TaxID=68185 RepID=UPI0019D2C252|nr:hypothetical protein [Streptomyces chrestomyceticus]
MLYADAYERLRAAGARLEEALRREPYATMAVFQGLYGNRWDLLQPEDNDARGIISDQT